MNKKEGVTLYSVAKLLIIFTSQPRAKHYHDLYQKHFIK